jgi:hypothetical protein
MEGSLRSVKVVAWVATYSAVPAHSDKTRLPSCERKHADGSPSVVRAGLKPDRTDFVGHVDHAELQTQTISVLVVVEMNAEKQAAD